MQTYEFHSLAAYEISTDTDHVHYSTLCCEGNTSLQSMYTGL